MKYMNSTAIKAFKRVLFQLKQIVGAMALNQVKMMLLFLKLIMSDIDTLHETCFTVSAIIWSGLTLVQKLYISHFMTVWCKFA